MAGTRRNEPIQQARQSLTWWSLARTTAAIIFAVGLFGIAGLLSLESGDCQQTSHLLRSLQHTAFNTLPIAAHNKVRANALLAVHALFNGNVPATLIMAASFAGSGIGW